MVRVFLLAASLLLSVLPASRAEDTPAAAAFDELRGLVGDWRGSFQWAGARTDSGRMEASYSLTGYGSALVETLSVDGMPSMTSVYHLDGADLRMTHCCGARNQPRLRADRIDLAKGILNFSFVDATNQSSPDAPRVAGLELGLPDADHLIMTFQFVGGGKESRERTTPERAQPRTS